MKKSILVTALLTMLVLTFGCKKDDSESTQPGFSAKVQGTLWTAKTTMAVHTTTMAYNQVLAVGTLPSEQFSIVFKGSGTGTFKFNDDNMASVVISNYNFTSMFSDTPVGEIVITKYDVANKKMSGTFSFNGEDIDGTVYNVTEGKFDDITLTVQ